MDRTCVFPDCSVDISLLPEHLLFCTNHQIKFKVFIQDVDHWNDEKLQQIDYFFLFLHQKGCNAENLSRHLINKIGSTNAKTSLRRGLLRGSKIGSFWAISFDEQLRAISLARNWTPIRRVGLANHINPYGFLKFIENDYETRTNLSGAISMRTAEAPAAVAAYKLFVKNIRQEGARSSKRFSKRGELSPKEFGNTFGVSGETVRSWIRKGQTNAQMRKSCWFLKKKEVKIFALKVLSGEISSVPEVIERSQQILKRKT